MSRGRLKQIKGSLAGALLVLAIVWGAVALRLWFTGRIELEGAMREGSLRCDDECHFELVLEGQPATTVRADSCIMPDTLRDWPGHPVQVMAAGHWEGEHRLKASVLLVRNGYWAGRKPSAGRPAPCFVPPRKRD